MVFKYDQTRSAAVDDLSGIIVRAAVRRGDVRHQRYASYELDGHSIQVPYYYFNKDVLDKTEHGLRKTRRPYKAIIPRSPANFDEFSNLYLKINGLRPSEAQYVAFLDQMKEGITANFRQNGEWDEFLQPIEVNIMDWKEAKLYMEAHDKL